MKKKLPLFIFILISYHQLFAQESRFPFELSVGGGVTTLYGDLHDHQPGAAVLLRFAYRLSPWLSIGVEGEHGLLRTKSMDRSSSNIFYSGLVDVRMRPVPFFNPRFHDFHRNQRIPAVVENFYIGTGGGLAFNYQLRPEKTPIDHNLAFVIPVNAGFDIPLTSNYITSKQLFFLNLNAQSVFSMNDGMDGYNTAIEENEKKDLYTFYSISLIMKL